MRRQRVCVVLFVLAAMASPTSGTSARIGEFLTTAQYSTGTNPNSVAAGDFNGDGKTDLVTANYAANSVSVLLGNGDSTFQRHVDYAVGLEPVAVAVGDFNGDGILDVVTANGSADTVSVLLGNGNGTVGSPQTFSTSGAPGSV